jgi:sulfatase maturation enzyme AslB (radical SAM superfamily)
MGVWNSENYQTLRKEMFDKGGREICSPSAGEVCLLRRDVPFSQTHINPTSEQLANSEAAMRSFQEGQTIVSHYPVEVYLILDVICNFDCIMCHQRSMRKSGDYNLLQVHLFEEELGEFIRHAVRFGIQGGETTISPAFSTVVNAAKNVGGRLDIMTNGSTLESTIVPNLSAIHTLQLSVDAASPEVYVGIRRGGNWDSLMHGLEATRRAIDETENPTRMEFRNVLMRQNHHEMVGMVELAARFSGSIVLEDIEWIDRTQDLSSYMFSEKDLTRLSDNLDAALARAKELGVEAYHAVRVLNRSGWQSAKGEEQEVEEQEVDEQEVDEQGAKEREIAEQGEGE